MAATGKTAWEAGGPAEWATESHALADQVASAIPSGGELDDAYMARALPVIHDLLAKAGVRRAWELNHALQ